MTTPSYALPAFKFLERVDYVVHGLSLATITGRWSGKIRFVQNCIDFVLPCLEMVEQRPCVRRGRLKPGFWIVGSVITEWLTTEANDQSSLHCVHVVVSTDAMSDHIGCWDASCGHGCSKPSACTSHFAWALMIWSMLSVTAFRCREEGATLVSTGSMRPA